MRHSSTDEDDWNTLWTKFTTSTNAAEKATLLAALGCTQNEKLLNNYLEKSLKGTDIRKQDASSVFKAVISANPDKVKLSMDFLDTNIDKIIETYGSMGALSNVIQQVADSITKQDQLETVSNY